MVLLGLNVHAAENSPADLTEMPLEALMNIEVPKVYGASKFEQKITEAPSSVTVITSDDIKRYGYRTLADVLRSVQGFYVSYDRNYAFLGSRGVNLGDFNSRVLVLVDGHRLNNNLTDGAYIDTAFILDVDLIDHVEIIRGPGSALYGNNAFFGVINVITRQGKQVEGAEVSAEYAQYDAYKGRVTYGKSFTNGLQLTLSGTLFDSEGHDRLFYEKFVAVNDGIAANRDADQFQSFFGRVAYKDFSLEGAYINREKQNPTAQFLTTFNDPRLRTTDDRSYAAFKYAHSFPDIVDVTAQVYYDRSDFGIGYPSPLFTREEDVGEWWGAELQLNKRLWDRHMVTFGTEYRDDFHQHRTIFEPGTPNVFTDASGSRQTRGVFAQGDFMVLTNLHFNGGVRYDQYGDFGPSFNPRLALIYNPWENGTLKAIYGKAFRAPNFLELSDPRFQDIRPEHITSYELVYEQGIGKHIRTSLAGFHNDLHDLIVLENGAFTNFDARADGMEVAIEGNWENGIRTRGSYTLETTRNRTSDQHLIDSPNQLIKLNVNVPLWKEKIFGGLEFQYTSSSRTEFTSTTGETDPGPDAGAFGVVNFTLFSQNLVKNLDVSASVYNLLDRRYSDPATRFHEQALIEQDGISFRFKATYRF